MSMLGVDASSGFSGWSSVGVLHLGLALQTNLCLGAFVNIGFS